MSDVPAVQVDLGGAVPPYEQIRAQLAGHVTSGRLRPGDRLPTVRALAADLGIAVGTVTRAYRELESQGLVASRRRTGTVVRAPDHGAGELRDPGLGEAAAVLVARSRAAGLGEERVLDLVRAALHESVQEARHARAPSGALGRGSSVAPAHSVA